MMDEFGEWINEDNINHITGILSSRKIKSCRFDDSRMNRFFIIEFDDGSEFSIEYDWLYEWKLTTNEPSTSPR